MEAACSPRAKKHQYPGGADNWRSVARNSVSPRAEHDPSFRSTCPSEAPRIVHPQPDLSLAPLSTPCVGQSNSDLLPDEALPLTLPAHPCLLGLSSRFHYLDMRAVHTMCPAARDHLSAQTT